MYSCVGWEIGRGEGGGEGEGRGGKGGGGKGEMRGGSMKYTVHSSVNQATQSELQCSKFSGCSQNLILTD